MIIINLIKKLLEKRNPNKYLEKYKCLKNKLISYGTSVDNKIWVSSDKEIMHVTKSELSILRVCANLGLQKEAEIIIKLQGCGIPTKIGIRYEPLSALAITAIVMASLEGLAMASSIGKKTAKFRAEKVVLGGKIGKFGEKFEDMSTTATEDFEAMQEQYQNTLSGMTTTVGQSYDELASTMQTITKQQGELKTGTTENIKTTTQEQLQEASKLTGEKAEFQYTDTVKKYVGNLENSRMALNNQLDDLKSRYQRAKRHDQWYENI